MVNGAIGEAQSRAPGQVVNPTARASVGTMYARADRDPVDPEVSEYV